MCLQTQRERDACMHMRAWQFSMCRKSKRVRKSIRNIYSTTGKVYFGRHNWHAQVYVKKLSFCIRQGSQARRNRGTAENSVLEEWESTWWTSLQGPPPPPRPSPAPSRSRENHSEHEITWHTRWCVRKSHMAAPGIEYTLGKNRRENNTGTQRCKVRILKGR